MKATNTGAFQEALEQAIEAAPKPNILLPELSCYLYISHLDNIDGQDFRFWHLPQFPDEITDSMQSTFSDSNALGRSAPVFAYSNSGPRTVTINLHLLRDLMEDLNVGSIFSQTISADFYRANEDYTDRLIKAIQSISLPKYNATNSAIEPPLVAVKFGNEFFIKGIINGPVSVTYQKPILDDEKYNQVEVSFAVTEVDPYDATTVFKNGSFRGLTNTFRQGMNMGG